MKISQEQLTRVVTELLNPKTEIQKRIENVVTGGRGYHDRHRVIELDNPYQKTIQNPYQQVFDEMQLHRKLKEMEIRDGNLKSDFGYVMEKMGLAYDNDHFSVTFQYRK